MYLKHEGVWYAYVGSNMLLARDAEPKRNSRVLQDGILYVRGESNQVRRYCAMGPSLVAQILHYHPKWNGEESWDGGAIIDRKLYIGWEDITVARLKKMEPGAMIDFLEYLGFPKVADAWKEYLEIQNDY